MAVVDGYTAIQVDSLTPHIGAQISGVALGNTLSNEQFSEIYQAWLDWKVLVFRDQELDGEQHRIHRQPRARVAAAAVVRICSDDRRQPQARTARLDAAPWAHASAGRPRERGRRGSSAAQRGGLLLLLLESEVGRNAGSYDGGAVRGRALDWGN